MTNGGKDAPASEKRQVALDAFRGFIMLVLVSNGLGLASLIGNPSYGGVAACFEHVEWEGLVFWDLVQPSFMFIVGAAMPFALSKRKIQGETSWKIFRHISVRSLKLLLLGQILTIIVAQRLQFQLIDVLSQIALTYFFAYLILQLRFSWQVVGGVLVLFAHSMLFILTPSGFSETRNIGAVLDRIILGYNYPANYVTINFISSTVTTLAGAWTAMLLMSKKTFARKLEILLSCSVMSLALGLALSPWIPIVKKIWTASFTLYSLGWVMLMMTAFILLVDYLKLRKWLFPFVIVGINSIFAYSIGILLLGPINTWLNPFTGGFGFVGIFAPVAQAVMSTLVLWVATYWLYRHGIFFKI